MWAEDHRLASAVMILPCSIVGSLSHRITLSLLFVTLPLLLAHWIRATSCIPGLRSSCFCFIHVPFLSRSRLMEPRALKTQLWQGFYCCSPGLANYPSPKAKTPLLGRFRRLWPPSQLICRPGVEPLGSSFCLKCSEADRKLGVKSLIKTGINQPVRYDFTAFVYLVNVFPPSIRTACQRMHLRV